MDAVVICRVFMNGKTSMCMTVDPQIRKFLGLSPRELIGIRCRTIKGKRIIVGEKVPLHAIAQTGEKVAEKVPAESE